MYFNNQVLPEMNHMARMLSSDISRKRPDLDFDVGYFIDAIPQYNILLGSREGEVFSEITIFSNPKTRAKRGFPENPQEMKQGKRFSVLHFPTATEQNPVFRPFRGGSECLQRV